ncbi:MAG: IS66 family insertion sequence element accessory protein TnpB [Lachnospiraceae bacterium]|nr:IS66 family insertion sequence element accessory protein TnpB [Lachnospiraceae bacterium]
MLESFSKTASHIIFACGATEFRKQSESLTNLVSVNFNLDLYEDDYIFVFCNKKRNAIKMLRYDHNGFVLASKKLLDGMKFQYRKHSIGHQWKRTSRYLSSILQ